MTVTIDDFVMLGTTVPEPTSSGRIFVCSAGVSRQLNSLVRIYPLARRDAPRRWERCEIALERNPQDSRHESFKIAGDRSASVHETINQRFTIVESVSDRVRPELLRPYSMGSIRQANALQQSLAVLHPRQIDLEWDRASDDDEDSPQLMLFDLPSERPSKPSARFKWIPRLVFRDEDGVHRLQIREWGVYELMRKHGDDYARAHLHRALHLSDQSSLLVGNQANRRTSWLVISVLQHVRVQAGLWDRMPSERPFIPASVRQRVWERDKGTCQLCGRPAESVDHIFPVIRGGLSTEENLQAICTDCNLSKSDAVPA